MNKLATIAITALLLTGCATSNKLTLQDFTPAIKTTAMVGTTVCLNEHPEWRAGFNEALADLKILESAPTIDFDAIFKIVNRLPIKELKSQNAQLAISGATILLSEYSSKIDLSKLENVRPLVTALVQGLELALN
jgi:ABC-type Fe3+-hydroxamate transport system substrate-binding protein